ncbi:hypothetical protein KNE206_39230 [Kitasatospora sp. NE20-6]
MVRRANGPAAVVAAVVPVVPVAVVIKGPVLTVSCTAPSFRSRGPYPEQGKGSPCESNGIIGRGAEPFRAVTWLCSAGTDPGQDGDIPHPATFVTRRPALPPVRPSGRSVRERGAVRDEFVAVRGRLG